MQEGNKNVALNATIASAKCLEMQKPDVSLEEGFTMTVRQADKQASKAETGPGRTGGPTEKKVEVTKRAGGMH
jgi:hypothetical protein